MPTINLARVLIVAVLAAGSSMASDAPPAPPAPPAASSIPPAEWHGKYWSSPQEMKNYRDLVQQYRESVEQSLRESASPRDWALSVMIDRGVSRAQHAALLRKAAVAAPEDRLVQWFWANASPEASGCDVDHPCPERSGSLARIDPDNGAAWIPVIADADQSKDATRVDEALAHVADATRFEPVPHEAMTAWRDLFRRYPAPASLWRAPTGMPINQALYMDTEIFNEASGASFYVRYAGLLHACTLSPLLTPARRENCAKAGRLMLEKSTGTFGRMIGEEVLYNSGTATDEDREAERVFKWQRQEWLRTSSTFDHPEAVQEDMEEEFASDNEIDGMQKSLRRKGIPLLPPANFPPAVDAPPPPPAPPSRS